MVQNTRGIVLHKTNYSENSIVVQLYTLHFGKLSILVQGAKKKRARSKIALFEPLSILELTGNFSNTAKLIRPTEISMFISLQETHTKISKSLIVLFLSEVIHKSIKESFPEPDLYIYLEKSLVQLEKTNDSIANFHLVFLVGLSRFLGFLPFKSSGHYFSISDGVFSNIIPSSGLYLKEEEKEIFYSLLDITLQDCHQLSLNSVQRKTALQNVLDYYKVHISNMGEIKSHHVLETIFQ